MNIEENNELIVISARNGMIEEMKRLEQNEYVKEVSNGVKFINI